LRGKRDAWGSYGPKKKKFGRKIKYRHLHLSHRGGLGGLKTKTYSSVKREAIGQVRWRSGRGGEGLCQRPFHSGPWACFKKHDTGAKKESKNISEEKNDRGKGRTVQ